MLALGAGLGGGVSLIRWFCAGAGAAMPAGDRGPPLAGSPSRSIPAKFTSCTMVGKSDPQRAQPSNLREYCSLGKMANL